MSNETLFSVTGNAFIVGWIALVAGVFLGGGTRWRSTLLVLGGRAVPVVLLLVFVTGVFLHRDIEPRGDLITYHGMLQLLSVPERLMNVWIEVLAYTLFACRWMIDEAGRRQVSKIPVLLCLLVAFISGGMGLLTFVFVVALHQLATRRLRSTPLEAKL